MVTVHGCRFTADIFVRVSVSVPMVELLLKLW